MPSTPLLKIHGTPPNQRHVAAATDALRKGGVILAPTETGYCFFADASRDAGYEALLKLRAAHPRQKPFSLLCADLKQVSSIANLDTPTFRIASRVLPGPYTFLLPTTRNTPQFSGAPKRKVVGVRVCSHPVAAALAAEFGEPIAVTSVTDAEELLADSYYEDVQGPDSWWVSPEAILDRFPNKVALALEWNEFVPMRVSTVVDFGESPPRLVRDGGWPLEELGLE